MSFWNILENVFALCYSKDMESVKVYKVHGI